MKKVVLCILVLITIHLVISRSPKIIILSENNKVGIGEILQKEITFSLEPDGIITMKKSILELSPLLSIVKIESTKNKKNIVGILDYQFELTH